MNRHTRWVAQALGNERGVVFPLVLVIVALVALLTVPVLSYVSDSLHRARASGEALQDVYATDAGFEDALWLLRHDPGFLDSLGSLTPAAYTIKVAGQDVPVEVSLYVPPPQTPTPNPTPTPKPGANPWMWTFLDPPMVNLAADPNPTIRANIYLYGTGAAQAHVYQIEYVLPLGWRYAGNFEAVGFYSDNAGTPFPPDQLLPDAPGVDNPHSRDIVCPGPIGGPDCADNTPPFAWPWTGPNPFDVVGSKCKDKTSVQNADEERLEWSWDSGGGGANAPRVDPGEMGRMSFDIQLQSNPGPGRYYDDPWTWVNQQWCSAGGKKSNLQAGWPSSVIIGMTLNITATSEDGDTTTASDVRIQDVDQILTYTSE